MAKLSFILALFLITFSFATISSAIPDDDVIDFDISTKKTLLLPSDNPQPDEITTTVGSSEILPENDETKTNEVSAMVLDHPMKIVRFHPINRHFPRSHLGSFRVPLHRCRHGGMRGKSMRPRQVSFGDDMMIPSAENGDFDPMVHVVREVAGRWIRIHRHHPRHLHHRRDGMLRFPMGKHHDFFADKRFPEEREKFPMGKHHDFFADKRFGEREERQDGGFMRTIRKFLNGQF